MPVSKDNSKWVNANWKVYICPECGNEYYLKYKDYEKCLFCACEEEDLSKNLSEYHKDRDQQIKEFKDNYKNKSVKFLEESKPQATGNRKGIKINT